MKKFICTFGSGHLGGFGLRYHVEVYAETETLARLAMNRAFAGWCGIYTPEFGYAERYNTKCLGALIVEGTPEFFYINTMQE